MSFHPLLSRLSLTLIAVGLTSQGLNAQSEGLDLLDPQLSHWEKWLGVPRKSVMGLPVGTPQSDDYNTGTPLGLNNDPKNVFTVVTVDGQLTLKVSGEIYGGLTTLQEFSNYHFSCEVKFGELKWPPRERRPRDSGLLYHCTGKHGAFWNVWMRCLEFQVQEENLGDLFPLAGAKADVPSTRSPQEIPGIPKNRWDPSQPFRSVGAVERGQNHESPHGSWTKAEFFVLGTQAIHVVNGHVVLSLDRARLADGTPLSGGKLQIQSEGSELYYRHIRLRPIQAFPAAYLAASKLPAQR